MHPLLSNGLKYAETSLVALGSDGRILTIDAIGAGWLGTTPDAVVGQGPWVFGGLVREAEWPVMWRRLETEGQQLIEGAIVGHGGQLYRLALQLSYVPADADRDAYVFVVAMRRAQPPDGEDPTLGRLNHASAFIDDPLIDWNVTTDELVCNAAAARLMGVEPGTRLSGDAARRMFPEETTELAPSFAGLVAGQSDRLSFVHTVEHEAGGSSDCLIRARVAARGPAGDVRRVVLHLVDVTALRRAQAEAREKQELFSAVAHTATAGIVILDTSGQIVFANARAEEVLGLSTSQIVGRRYDAPQWRSTAPDGGVWPDEAQPFVRVMTSGAPVRGIEHAIEWPDGSRRQLSISGEPLFDEEGRIERVLFAVEDISERVAVAERLAASERRLRDVLDRLTVGVHLVDGDGRLLLWNRQAAIMFRHAEGGAAADGVNYDAWTLVDSEDRRLEHADFPLVRALREGRPTRDVVLGVSFAGDDAQKWARVSATPRVDEAGRVVDVVTQIIDVTEQRRLEQRLREVRQLEALGRLAGGVAHDFNNLLTVVLAEAEVIADSLALSDPLRSDVDGIRRAATRGAALVRALLGFAQRQFRRPQATDVHALLGRLARRWQRRCGGGIDLCMRVFGPLPTVVLDPEQFEQVFEALLDNARDAMPGGGAIEVQVDVITLDEARASAPRTILEPGRHLRLIVGDEGAGVPVEAVQRIFEPFFSTASIGERAGLGLANAHGIVQQNGGDIRLTANGPEGATFEVLWPVRPPAGRGDDGSRSSR